MQRSWASKLAAEPIVSHPDIFSHQVFVRVGKARYEPYPYISNLKVVVRLNVTAQNVHEIFVVVF